MKMVKEVGVEVVIENFYIFYDLERIIELNGQKLFFIYKCFQVIISCMELFKKLVGLVISQQMESCRVEIQENYDEIYGVFFLEELGFFIEGFGLVVWQGGEIEVLVCLDKYLEWKVWVVNYERF